MSDTPFLIVGLGNPGPRYESTRHNVGWLFLDAMTDGLAWKSAGKFRAEMATGRLNGAPVIWCKPQTFMNLSGEAVGPLARYYHIPPENVVAVYDEAALPFGKIRVRPKGSAAGHNGMKSLIQHLSTADFPRLRIGIGDPPPQWEMADYVLAPFTPEECQGLPAIFEASRKALGVLIESGAEDAMNAYNAWQWQPPASD